MSMASMSASYRTGTSLSSQSSSNADEEARKQRHLENTIFPLYAEMSRYATIPRLFYGIQYLISCIQAIAASMWLGSSMYWQDGGNLFYKILYAFCDIGMKTSTGLAYLSASIVGLVFFVITVTVFFISENSYKNKHSFYRWELYVMTILVGLILPLLIPVFAAILGHSISQVITNTNSFNIAFLIIYAILFIASCVIMHFSSGFTINSPVLLYNEFGMWDYKIYPTLTFITSITILLSDILDHFNFWLAIVANVLLCIASGFLARRLFNFPFFKVSVAKYCGLPMYFTFFSYILNIIPYFGVQLNVYIKFFVPLGLGLIADIIGYIFIWKKYNTVKQKLMSSSIATETEERFELTESDKNEYFESFVFRNVDDAISYLRIGLAERCDLFLDFSFVRYLVMNYAERSILMTITQFVAFFPSELQMLTQLLGTISGQRGLSLIDKFFIYQVNKIHITRQSSVSVEAKSGMLSVKNKARKVIATVRCIWPSVLNSQQNISFETLSYIRNESLELESELIDMTEKFPNNAALYDEYATFLIEAMGNFSRALHCKNQAAHAESGKKTSKDYVYLSMVNIFPEYLFLHITDQKGNFCQKATNLSNASISSSSFSSSSSGFSNSSSTLDEDFEVKNDELLSNYIKDGHMRIAMQNILKKTNLSTIKILKAFIYTSLVVFIVVSVAIFLVIPSIADTSLTNVKENNNFALASTSFSSITFGSALKIAQHGLMQGEPEEHLPNKVLFHTQASVEAFTGLWDTLPPQGLLKGTEIWTHRETIVCTNAITNVFYSIVAGNSRQETVSAYVNGTSFMSAFDNSNQLTLVPMSLKAAFAAVINNVKFGLGVSDVLPDFYDEVTMISLLKTAVINGVNLPEYILSVTNMLSTDGFSAVASQRIILYVLSYGLSALLLLIFMIFACVLISKYFHDYNKITKVLHSVKKEAIEESTKPIQKGAEDKDVDIGGSINLGMTDKLKILLPGTTITMTIILCLLILFATWMFAELDSFQNVFTFYKASSSRHSHIYHFVNTLIAFNLDMINISTAIQSCQDDSKTVQEAHTLLMTEAIGYDDKLDDIQLNTNYTGNVDSNSMYMISKSSLNKRVFYCLLLMNEAIEELKANGNYSLDSKEFTQILYILDTGLDRQLIDFNKEMSIKAENVASGMSSKSRIISVVSIAIVIIVFCILYAILLKIQTSFQGFKQLIAVLPPKQCIGNKILMDAILGEEAQEDEEVMSFSQMIINASDNIVLSLSPELIIENVNKSLKKITGFGNDIALRQNLTWLIPAVTSEESQSCSGSTNSGSNPQELYDEIEGMRRDPETNVIKKNVLINCESGATIPVTATVIALRENDEIVGFLIALADRTQEFAEKEAVKSARIRSFKLLRGLLPQEAFNALKKQNADTLFVSEKAIVIFVNINGFTDIINVLQPSDVMDLLKTVYEKFDEVRRKYPAVERLKIIDELMLCCAGLFNYKDDFEQQAIQSVMFTNDLLAEIPAINDAKNVNLGLSIGLNSGGPLCGSVLDVKTPTFDIIGLLIGNAMKMVNEGKQNVVQVSEEISRYLPADKFDITPGTPLVAWATKAKTPVFDVKAKNNS